MIFLIQHTITHTGLIQMLYPFSMGDIWKKKALKERIIFVVVSYITKRFALIIHDFELLFFMKHQELHGHPVYDKGNSLTLYGILF
jgi:hypothetical protein